MAASDFIAKYGDAADQVSKETGIPAERILGQAGLETGWSVNSPGNNFFGIKAGGGYAGKSQNLATREADANGNLVPTTQSFRAYDDPTDSFRDYGRLIQSGYRGALDPDLTDAQFAHAIKAGGYATDPNYAGKLTGSIATARQHHRGGWENVPDANQVIGAGVGLAPGGPDSLDSGWEPVPGAAPPADTDTPAPPQAGSKDYALADVPGAALSNIPKNAGEVWDAVKSGVGNAVSDPVGTAKAVGNGLWGGAVGAVMPDVRAILRKASPQTLPGVEDWAARQGAGASPLDPIASKEKLGQLYEDTKRDVAEKPVEVAANAAMLAAPGAGGLVRGGARLTGAAVGPVVRAGTELLSGVSSDAQRLASRAGELGGAEGGAFRQNMAHPDWTGMQDTVQRAKQGARAERNANYQAGMSDVAANNPGPLNNAYAPAIQAAQDARAAAYDNGFLKHADVPAVMDEIDAAIGEHFNNPAQTGNAVSMDALKQRLRGIMMAEKEGTPARRAASTVYNAVRDDIATQTPGYGDVMNAYGGASRDINNAISSLGAGERASRFSTGGKLISAMRSDASVARGAREQSLADMARQEPTLPYQIAGATMNPALPRGIVGRGNALLHAGAVGGAAAFIPALIKALPALLASSPRLVGEVRYALGAATRGARRAGVTQRNIGNTVDIARLLGAQQNNRNQ